MSAQERPTRNNGTTDGPRTEPKAQERQDEHRQARGKRLPIILAGLAFVVVVVAGFVIVLIAGRVPADRGRDVPPPTVQSSLMGSPGDNSNNEGNTG